MPGGRAPSQGHRRRGDREHFVDRSNARRGKLIADAASKGALNTLTISMARALAPQVRVNALCPGGLLGSWTRKIMTDEQYEARVRQANTEFPLRRGIWPIDVARAALFLIEHAVAMTGECLRMDAGEHLGANLIRN